MWAFSEYGAFKSRIRIVGVEALNNCRNHLEGIADAVESNQLEIRRKMFIDLTDVNNATIVSDEFFEMRTKCSILAVTTSF